MSRTQPFGTSETVPAALHTKLEEVWPEVQSRLIALRPMTPHVLATGRDHYVQVHAPDLTIATIEVIVQRARALAVDR